MLFIIFFAIVYHLFLLFKFCFYFNFFIASAWYSSLFLYNTDVSLDIYLNCFLQTSYFYHHFSFLRCDILLDIVAVDYLIIANLFFLYYLFLSYRYNFRVKLLLKLKSFIMVPTLSKLFRNSSWLEREVWDLFGIFFLGHMNLRRILTDYGFKGHALRKLFPVTGFSELFYNTLSNAFTYVPVLIVGDRSIKLPQLMLNWRIFLCFPLSPMEPCSVADLLHLSANFNLSFWVLEFFIIFLIFYLFLFSLFYKNTTAYKILYVYRFYIFSFFFLLVVGFFCYFISMKFFMGGASSIFFNKFLIVDFKINLIKYLLLIFVFFILVFSFSYGLFYRNYFYLFDFPIILFLLFLNLCFFISCYDFFSFFLNIELIGYCSYILMGLKRGNLFVVESSLKYFILNAIISNFILLAIVFIFFQCGTTSMLGIKDFLLLYSEETHPILLYFGLFLIFCVLIFKLGAAPFHFWVPDVYEGTNFPVLSVLVLLVKSSYFFFFIFYLQLLSQSDPFFFSLISFFLTICGFLSLFFGTFGALYQKKLKRFFAYASISHMGFIFFSLSLGSSEGFVYAIFYFIVYILLNLALFAFLENYVEILSGKRLQYITDLKLLVFNPLDSTRFLFFFLLLAFAGLPPTGGFLSKAGIFFALAGQGYYFILLTSLIFTFINCFYYIRLVLIFMLGDSNMGLVSNSKVLLNISKTKFIWTSLYLKHCFFFFIFLQIIFFFFFDEIFFFILYVFI